MYKIAKTLIVNDDEVEIVPFGDVHLGSKNCRIDKFKRLIDWVKPRKNTYLIGMGDYLESILPKDKRYEANEEDSYDTLDDLKEQLIDMLNPIKDKIVCLLTGNHEHTLKKDGYGDPTKHICNRLGIKYGGFCAYIKLQVKPATHRRALTIWCHHGWFAGRKRGAKVNNLEDNLAYYDADIYLAGHSHDLWSTRKSRIYWSGSRDVIFGNTGSYLETAKLGTTSYAERANYPPQKLGCLKIKWLPKEEKIYVSQ